MTRKERVIKVKINAKAITNVRVYVEDTDIAQTGHVRVELQGERRAEDDWDSTTVDITIDDVWDTVGHKLFAQAKKALNDQTAAINFIENEIQNHGLADKNGNVITKWPYTLPDWEWLIDEPSWELTIYFILEVGDTKLTEIDKQVIKVGLEALGYLVAEDLYASGEYWYDDMFTPIEVAIMASGDNVKLHLG